MDISIDNKMNLLVARVSKVRRWLAAIAIFKVAAVCMLFVCGYIGVYIWLDHRLNFGGLERIIALLLLVAGAAIVGYKLSRMLLVQISYTNAANYIENKNSFNQQLVAAMEYYEKKTDYPYSKALAEQLVARACDDSETFRFDSVIRKWHGYMLAAVVLCGFGVVSVYIHQNLSYLKTYLTRLALPLATIEPAPTTSLEPVTKDFVAEPESILTFTADIQGKIPENEKLVLEPLVYDSNESPSGDLLNLPIRQSLREEIPVSPIVADGSNPKLQASKYFEQAGLFRYRFEAGSVHSEWHDIDIHEAPKIEEIMAEVSLPVELLKHDALKNYAQQIKDNKLEVIKNSTVTLQVRTSDKLNNASITGLNGQSSSEKPGNENTFTYTFTADKDGSLGFYLTDEKGLTNSNVPNLEIKLKTDEPPQFKLISPESDYLATNVASIPIEFEVTDDFGLSSIQMHLELPHQKPTILDIPVEKGEKQKKFTYLLELEQYDLEVGDSILFYARASDVTTGIIPEQNNITSDLYFIEIRPYQQFWHLMPGGEGKGSGGVPESLITILEYTRAIVKKTSTIASRQTLTTEDNSKLDSIADDVKYCSELLEMTRDDPEMEFTDAQKAILNQVLVQYEQAAGFLSRHDAPAALTPEKDAYRILRKFIVELELLYNPPSSGQSPPQEKPDSVKLQESTELAGIEKERIDAEILKVQRNIEKLKQEQKQLKTDFENFLEQQKQASIKAQTEQENKSSTAEGNEQKQQEQSSSGKGQEGSEQKDQSEATAQSSGDGSAGSKQKQKDQAAQGNNGSEGKGDSQSQQNQSQSTSQSEGRGQSGTKGQSSETAQQLPSSSSSSQSTRQSGEQEGTSNKAGSAESAGESGSNTHENEISQARLKMLRAKQRALQEKTSQLKQDLENLPQSPDAPASSASQQAQKHLNEAVEKMEQFQEKLDESRYEAQPGNRKATEAALLMDSAQRNLESAENALEPGMVISEKQQQAQKAQQMAEQLAEDAAALDETLTPLEREQMLDRLKAAVRLLESMTVAQWATVQKSTGQSGGGNVLTKDSSSASDTAREISRQFWSIALNAQKQRAQPIEDEPSDAGFYELENEFFENAAKYRQESDKK
jgi:hypothetical protein